MVVNYASSKSAESVVNRIALRRQGGGNQPTSLRPTISNDFAETDNAFGKLDVSEQRGVFEFLPLEAITPVFTAI